MKKLKEKVLKKDTYVHINNEQQLVEIFNIIKENNKFTNTIEEICYHINGGIIFPCYIKINKKYEWEYFEEFDVEIIEANAIYEDIKLIEYDKAFENSITYSNARELNIKLSKSVEQEEYGKVLINEIYGR